MNFGWCSRVEARKNVAGKNCEWKRLVARAVKIASGKLVVFIERMIDFCDQAVDVIRRRRGDEEVRFAAVIEERQRPVRRRPGIAREQTSDNGICWTAKGSNLAWIRDTCS